MKARIGGLLTTILVCVICFSSCTKKLDTDLNLKREVTFSFEQKDLKAGPAAFGLKSGYLKEDARYIVITIEKSNGEKVYTSKRLELYNFSGSFISQSIALEVANTPYKLTEFLVLDLNYKVIFATPLESSALAYLVTDPLPISFTVTKNQITKVVPEVLSTELNPVKDFGYATFDFNVIITPIRIQTSVQCYNLNSKKWDNTNANVLIKGIPGDSTLYNDSVAAMTDTINIREGFDSYKISVSKSGYISKDTTLTNAALKTYINNPLIFLLQKELVTDIDGNVYNTVTIGTQVWMQENLKVTRYRNGDSIPNADVTGYHSREEGFYSKRRLISKNIDGIIYNWYSVIDARHIAPSGWHVPTTSEWTALSTYLGGENVAGGKMKEEGTQHWLSPNADATNESGFTALPFFLIITGGSPDFPEGKYCHWWSSSKDPNSGEPICRGVNWYSGYLGTLSFKKDLIHDYPYMSIRCIKD